MLLIKNRCMRFSYSNHTIINFTHQWVCMFLWQDAFCHTLGTISMFHVYTCPSCSWTGRIGVKRIIFSKFLGEITDFYVG